MWKKGAIHYCIDLWFNIIMNNVQEKDRIARKGAMLPDGGAILPDGYITSI